MVEVGILLTTVSMLMAIGLIIWRCLCDPTQQRFGMGRRIVVLSLAIVPMVLVSTWSLSKSRNTQVFGTMVKYVDTSSPVVALTFDDGPIPGFTEEILEILRAEGVRATFFVVGHAVEENLAAAQRIVEEGHELGNHSYSHKRMVFRPYSFVREEIERTDELIRAAGYEGDIHFRPPYGKRLVVLPYYLSVTERMTVFMDVEPESYSEIAADSERIVEHVLEETRPGSIILLHVMSKDRSETMKAVPEIIRGLRSKGYRFVTLSELLAFGQ